MRDILMILGGWFCGEKGLNLGGVFQLSSAITQSLCLQSALLAVTQCKL